MIPVGVGKGLVASYGQIAERELKAKKTKKTVGNQSRKGWAERLFGIQS